MDALIRNRAKASILENGDVLLYPSRDLLPCGAPTTDDVVRAFEATGDLTTDEVVAYHRAALGRV